MEACIYDMDDKGKVYKVKLTKTMGGRTIQKEIELPFKPYKGLVIRISDEEGYRIEASEWDQEGQCFNARCLTFFESIRNEPLIVQPIYGQKDYDERIAMHLELGWQE